MTEAASSLVVDYLPNAIVDALFEKDVDKGRQAIHCSFWPAHKINDKENLL